MDKDYKKINETHQIEGARQKKLKKRRISYFILLLIIACSFFYICYRYLFKINSIEFIGNSYYSTDILLKEFGVKEGDRLFSYSKSDKEEKILDAFPYLSECEIKRKVPDKITVTVSERKSVMFTYVSGKYVIFDIEMHVVELCEERPKGLFEVVFEDEIIVKRILGEEIVFNDKKTGVGVRRVYEAISESSMFDKINKVILKSRFDYYLDYEGKYTVYLGDSRDCPSKLLFLSGILKKLPGDSGGKINVSNPKEGYFKEEK